MLFRSLDERARDAEEVDAGMRIEILVLGRQERLDNALGDRVHGHEDTPFLGILGDEGAVARMIADYRNRLESCGFTVHSVVNYGDPKNLLVGEANNWNADSIFVGAKGHNIIERILIGSVSTSIIAKADCSVEVIRQGNFTQE